MPPAGLVYLFIQKVCHISTNPYGAFMALAKYLSKKAGRGSLGNTLLVAVSCGYDTCFAVEACDGLCHLLNLCIELKHRQGYNGLHQPLSDTL